MNRFRHLLKPSDLILIGCYFAGWVTWLMLGKHEPISQALAAAWPLSGAFALGWVATAWIHRLIERRIRARRLRQPMQHAPPPPQNVRLQLANGEVIPVECAYLGERDGVHRWETVTEVGLTWADLVGAQVRCDVLPPRTAVTLKVGDRGEAP